MKKFQIKLPQLQFTKIKGLGKRYAESLTKSRKTQLITFLSLTALLFIVGEFTGIYSVGLKGYVTSLFQEKVVYVDVNPKVISATMREEEGKFDVLKLEITVSNSTEKQLCLVPGGDIQIGGRNQSNWQYMTYLPAGWNYVDSIPLNPGTVTPVTVEVWFDKDSFVPENVAVNSKNSAGCTGLSGFAVIELPTAGNAGNGGSEEQGETSSFAEKEQTSLSQAVAAFVNGTVVQKLTTSKSGIIFSVPTKSTYTYTQQKTLIGNEYGEDYEYQSDNRATCFAFDKNGTVSDREIQCAYETILYTFWSSNRIYKMTDGFDIYINSYPQSITNVQQTDYNGEVVNVDVGNTEVTFLGKTYQAITLDGTIFFTFQLNGTYYTIVRDQEYTVEAGFSSADAGKYDENVFNAILASAKQK